MKFAAPRCSERILSRSMPDGSLSAGAPPPAAKLVVATNAVADTRSLFISLALSMVNHPLRYRLRLVYRRVVRHQQEEREVQHAKELRHTYVNAFCGLNAQPTEHQERDDEYRQRDLVNRATVANRLDARTVEPWQQAGSSTDMPNRMKPHSLSGTARRIA